MKWLKKDYKKFMNNNDKYEKVYLPNSYLWTIDGLQ